jgi:hypothetical protein
VSDAHDASARAVRKPSASSRSRAAVVAHRGDLPGTLTSARRRHGRVGLEQRPVEQLGVQLAHLGLRACSSLEQRSRAARHRRRGSPSPARATPGARDPRDGVRAALVRELEAVLDGAQHR